VKSDSLQLLYLDVNTNSTWLIFVLLIGLGAKFGANLYVIFFLDDEYGLDIHRHFPNTSYAYD